MGIIHELGVGVTGYEVGDRVLVGAITPCGKCLDCLRGDLAQCGGTIGGWRFGNTINRAQAEYLLVPYAQANLAKIPSDLQTSLPPESPQRKAPTYKSVTAWPYLRRVPSASATAGAKLKGASLFWKALHSSRTLRGGPWQSQNHHYTLPWRQTSHGASDGTGAPRSFGPLRPLLTHKVPLERITKAYRPFGERRDNVIKVAVAPGMV